MANKALDAVIQEGLPTEFLRSQAGSVKDGRGSAQKKRERARGNSPTQTKGDRERRDPIQAGWGRARAGATPPRQGGARVKGAP